ncbi:ROK family protein [Nocardia macrotermitis]|uniref:N-acetylmannosamine kinase n=1 Tax=Nocardia macrotermitis TaxID=2585198 RepID=A0A7K0DCZ9_9NOCA|nr:ROK family protein [Nocardia macrotermitis]MQY23653.1 N-acetylmannosamine kinase [Nocardia macrotermitis]
MTILALEIGPEGFAVGPVAEDADDEDIQRIPIPAEGVWDACRDLLLDVAADEEVTAVGIASAGPIDMSAGVIAPIDIAEWQTGFAIVEAVQKLFPVAVVRLAIDGVCLGLAERTFGATHSVMDAMSVTVSHRISAGVMVGGFVVVGRTGNAGNLGHVQVPGFDDPCECGGRGCLESVAGGAALLRWARGRGWTGNSLAALTETAKIGDEIAVEAMGRAGTALGRAIASVAPLLDIDLVVVGGRVAESGPALWKPLAAAVATHARLGFLTGLRVVPSELQGLGPLAGAGVLAMSADQAEE